ncbi:SDR family NAD(P)-dependent oxidoreductase, partial [Arthrobacter ginsengisoli]
TKQGRRESGSTMTGAARLDGKFALVTGASQGIGAAIAAALATAGAHVVLASRNEAAPVTAGGGHHP